MQLLSSLDTFDNFQYDLIHAKHFLKHNFQVSRIHSSVPYHCYWYGNFNQRHFVSVMSCIKTQSNAKVHLWLDIQNGYHENCNTVWLSRLREQGVVVRSYSPTEMSVGTPLEGQEILTTKNLPLRADCCRYLILHKIGGVYFDLDVVFIRDMKNIIHLNFVYEWSNLRDGNNAIMNMTKNSADTLQILNSVKNIGLNMVNCRQVFSHKVHFENLFCLPSTFFDPVWLCVDNKVQPSHIHTIETFDEFFSKKRQDDREFFPFCFAYHYHGRWNKNIEKGSWFDYYIHKYSLIE
jgi:hypothetical protein